jgi:hypothetical protein
MQVVIIKTAIKSNIFIKWARAGSGPAKKKKKNQLKPQKLVDFIFHLLFRKLENLDKQKSYSNS